MLNIGNNGTISSNFNYDNRIHHTVLHELGHSIAGLPDSSCNEKGGKQCTNKCCWRHGEENARPKDCLMANQEHEMSYYTNENLLCSVCKQDAIEYIKANF